MRQVINYAQAVGCLLIKDGYNGPAMAGNMCTSILLEQNSSESQLPSCPKMYVGRYKMRVVLRNLSFSCICICRVVAKGSPHNEVVKNTSTATPNPVASFNVLCSTFGKGDGLGFNHQLWMCRDPWNS